MFSVMTSTVWASPQAPGPVLSSTRLRGDAYSSNMTSNQSARLWKFPSFLMLMNFRSSILTISSLCTQRRSRVSPTVMGLLSKEGNWNTMPSSAREVLVRVSNEPSQRFHNHGEDAFNQE